MRVFVGAVLARELHGPSGVASEGMGSFAGVGASSWVGWCVMLPAVFEEYARAFLFDNYIRFCHARFVQARSCRPRVIGHEGEGTMEIEIKQVALVLRGLPGSPLVIHQFAEKAKQEIRDKQAKKAKKAKEERRPEEEFLAARYVDEKGRECAPITAIKKSLVSAGTAMENLTKVALRQALFVKPTLEPSSLFCPIETCDGKPAVGVMREDAVTIGINTRGLAYRPGYDDWQLRVTVEYNPRLISLDQLLGLVKLAGWGVGLCEGRPERSSALGWGRYACVEHKEVE